MARIKKGDQVVVLSGKDRGKSGKVLAVYPERAQALVEKINMVKHFERKSQQQPTGGVIAREHAMALGKLAPMCPKCQKPARVRVSVSGDGARSRTCHRCQGAL